MSHAHQFRAEGDVCERLEGEERRAAVRRSDVLRFLRVCPDEVVADLGCGTGYFALPLARQARRLWALDVEPKMLAVLRPRIPPLLRRKMRLRRARAEATGLPASGIDLALLAFVFHELGAPVRFRREMARILAPGGRLVIADFRKRRTPFGPPVSIRQTPRQVARRLAPTFALVRSREFRDYYLLEFRGGSELRPS